MSKKYVVTPLYYVSSGLLEDLKGASGLIILDSPSPIFPIDVRENWIEKTNVLRNMIIESIPQNEDDEDIINIVINKIRSIEHVLGNEFDVSEFSENINLVFYTHYAMEEYPTYLMNVGCDIVTNYIPSPLDLKLEDLDEPFRTRFGEQFMQFITPKKEQRVVKEDEIVIIPYYNDTFTREEGEVEMNVYGAMVAYPKDVIEMYSINLEKFMAYSILEAIIFKHIEHMFGGFAIKSKYLGTIDGKVLIACLMQKPDWIDETSPINSTRKFLVNEYDVIFLPSQYFKTTSSLAYQVIDMLESVDE